MNYRKLITVVIIILSVIGLRLQYAEARVLTINDALKRAFEHNREYIKAVHGLEKSSAQITEARAGAFPVISASGGYTRNWEPNTFVMSFEGESQEIKIGTDNSFTAGLTLSQPLYLGGKVGTALRIAKLYRKYSRQNLIMVFNKVRLDVYLRYYGYIRALDMVRVALQANTQARASREVVEKMFSQGLVSEYDLLRAKVAEANTEPALIQARSAASTAGDALKSTLGMNLSEGIEPATEYNFTGMDTILAQPVDYYRELALMKRSDIKGLEYMVEMLDRNIRIEKSAYLPSLFFSTEILWQAQRDDWDLDPDYWSRSISSSLMLKIPIFEGFGRSAKVKQARIEKQKAELDYQQFRDVVELEVNSAYGNLKEAYERLNSQRKTVEMAKEGLRIAELRFKNGIGTQLEVIDARTALVVAETNLANAKHDLIVSLAGFEKAIGVITRDIQL